MCIQHDITMYSVSNSVLIAVVSRQEIENVVQLYNKIIDKISIISITDPDRECLDTSLICKYKNSLEIKFWDLEEDFSNYKIITSEQGSIIRKFIEDNELFVVHCEAGISRSAAVGKAIECIKYYNSDVYLYSTSSFDDSIRKHCRYFPNKTVFDIIMHN